MRCLQAVTRDGERKWMETKYFSLSLLLSPPPGGGGEQEEGKRASLAVPPPLLALAWHYNREREEDMAPLWKSLVSTLIYLRPL